MGTHKSYEDTEFWATVVGCTAAYVRNQRANCFENLVGLALLGSGLAKLGTVRLHMLKHSGSYTKIITVHTRSHAHITAFYGAKEI